MKRLTDGFGFLDSCTTIFYLGPSLTLTSSNGMCVSRLDVNTYYLIIFSLLVMLDVGSGSNPIVFQCVHVHVLYKIPISI